MLQHYDHKDLCIIPIGGLGNRLLATISALRLLYKGYYNSLTIAWEITVEASVPFTRLWQVPGQIVHANHAYGLPVEMSMSTRIPVQHRLVICMYGLFSCVLDQAHSLDEYIEVARQIQPTREIQDLAASYDVSHMVGLHCRRSDYSMAPCGGSTPWPLVPHYHQLVDQRFADFIAKNYPGEQLLLCSDSEETLTYFRDKFGTKLLSAPHQCYPNWKGERPAESVIEAARDMLLLSKCRCIVADSRSTFPLVASCMGGIHRQVWDRPHYSETPCLYTRQLKL